MKTKILTFFILILYCTSVFSQVSENEFVSSNTSVTIPFNEDLIKALQTQNRTDAIAKCKLIPEIKLLISEFTNEIDSNNTKYALIFIFRTLSPTKIKVAVKDEKGGIKMDAEGNPITNEVNAKIMDENSSKVLIYYRKNKWHDSEFSKFLLEAKHIRLVFVDLSDEFYDSKSNVADRLSNTTIKIDYKKSFFKQSVKDLSTVLAAMGGEATKKIEPTKTLMKITFVDIEPKRVKAPCTLVLSNKSFTSDLKFEIHEKNIASAQIGLVNTKFALNNFSIADGNLIVTPDSTQQKEWKSNVYALLELHLPRDIDNFQPLWKELFTVNKFKKKGKAIPDWLYRNTLHRIGIYGGLKISKDPLSNLYAGFNYAITKELYVNFGWTWANEITPQVTDIGSITSIEEAKQYAKRDYSKPNFSIGLSFSPSSVITMLGLKEKSSE